MAEGEGVGMAEKIIQFRQMELPLKWWQDSEKWRNHYSVGVVDRPTEDDALENIFTSAKSQSRRQAPRLSPIEYKICRLEVDSYRKCPRYFNQAERERWIAKESGLGVQMVKDILRDADRKVFLSMAIEEANKTHRELVREVLAEIFPYVERAA